MKECPECGNEYKRIAAHFQHNESHRPKLTKEQHEIITGLLMSDGHVEKTSSGSYRIKVNSVTKKYLKYLSKKFKIFSKDIYLNESAEDSKKRTLSRGGRFENAENFNDVWSWQTCSIPELSIYRKWYGSKGKCWPENINLTPITLKHLYVGDGCWDKRNERIRISMMNERGDEEKVEKYFKEVNLPLPKWNSSNNSHAAYWSKSESVDIFNYMGEPIDGFKYKWP